MKWKNEPGAEGTKRIMALRMPTAPWKRRSDNHDCRNQKRWRATSLLQYCRLRAYRTYRSIFPDMPRKGEQLSQLSHLVLRKEIHDEMGSVAVERKRQSTNETAVHVAAGLCIHHKLGVTRWDGYGEQNQYYEREDGAIEALYAAFNQWEPHEQEVRWLEIHHAEMVALSSMKYNNSFLTAQQWLPDVLIEQKKGRLQIQRVRWEEGGPAPTPGDGTLCSAARCLARSTEGGIQSERSSGRYSNWQGVERLMAERSVRVWETRE